MQRTKQFNFPCFEMAYEVALPTTTQKKLPSTHRKVISGIVDRSSLFNMEKYFPEEKEKNTDDLTLLVQ